MITCTLITGNDYDQRIRALPRRIVFESLDAVPIEGIPTAETCRRADLVWDRIQQARSFKPRCIEAKRSCWHQLFHAATRAAWINGCIRYRRNRSFSRAVLLQIIRCSVEAELFVDFPRKPGYSNKSGRLIPTAELRQYLLADPSAFDPQVGGCFVSLFTRKSPGIKRRELAIDAAHKLVVDTQSKLALINAVNSGCAIIYCAEDPHGVGLRSAQLRPIHHRRFTERWDWHGRLYTVGRYGHQNLGGEERKTIQFNGQPSVEVDFQGMHPRLCYHLAGIPFASDPYKLWGNETSDAQRRLTKQIINTAINAKTAQKTVQACWFALRLTTASGARKQGNKLKRAIQLRDDLEEVGVEFRDASVFFRQVFDLAAAFHEPIAHCFGSDAGIKLMRVDSDIAIDVLYYFAVQSIPAIGVHDSVIVPRSYQQELRQVMTDTYRAKVGFEPVLKG